MLYTLSCVTVHKITATDFVFLSISRQRARCVVSAAETDDHQGARHLGDREGGSHRQGPLQFDRVREGISHLYTLYTNSPACNCHVYLTLFTSLILVESAFIFPFVVERLRPTLSICICTALNHLITVLKAHIFTTPPNPTVPLCCSFPLLSI